MKNSNTQKYIETLCIYINELIKAHEDKDYQRGSGFSYEQKYSDFLAIKLGIATLDGDLPSKAGRWDYDYRKRQNKPSAETLAKLRVWKAKAKQVSVLESNIPEVETEITKTNIERYIHHLQNLIEGNSYNTIGLISNPVSASSADKLAAKLGVVHKEWVLAHNLGLPIYPYSDNEDDKALFHEMVEDLGLPLHEARYPCAVNAFDDSQIPQERLEIALKEALNLREKFNQATLIPCQTFDFSEDCRSVVHTPKIEFSFTATQAACFKILYLEWQKGTPDISQETLLDIVGSDAERLRDIFKGHSAWNTIIVQGKTKGTFRLAEIGLKKLAK